MIVTNKHDIPLPLAVWLVTHEYDSQAHIPNYMSATTLLRPVRQVVLSERVRKDKKLSKTVTKDVSDFFNARRGTSFHDSLEYVWRNNKLRTEALLTLGFTKEDAEAVIINPEPEQLTDDVIPVYVELRSFRKLGKYTIGGKFDLAIENTLFDHKSTSVWTFLKDYMEEEYIIQMSIYRWLNPQLELDDTCHIQMIFTDWDKNFTKNKDPNSEIVQKYPKTPMVDYPITLWSEEKTEAWLKQRIEEYELAKGLAETDIPLCEDVWQGDTVYKYFSDPKNKRATKSSDKLEELQVLKAKNGKGVIFMEEGKVRRCNPKFCDGYAMCTQKDEYLGKGLLDLDED